MEKASEEKIKKPACIAGERADPPEDCGGIGGYNEMINHLLHPEKDGYLELLEWLGDHYDPEAFDIANVNRHLKSLNYFIRVFDVENGLIFGKSKKKNLRPPTIEISEMDLLLILQDDFLDFAKITVSDVFCPHCTGNFTNVGIRYCTIILTPLNDIQLNGRCSICGGKVGHYIEYSEDPEIFRRAEAFRETHRSRKSMKVVKRRK